jgi:circadian clock protein KaiB
VIETVNRFERAADDDEVFYELTLFVSGASALAARATQLCEDCCSGHYHLSVIDIHEDPSTLLTNNLLATPTLIKSLPAPARRVVGDLSQTDKVLVTLDLPAAPGIRERSVGPA